MGKLFQVILVIAVMAMILLYRHHSKNDEKTTQAQEQSQQQEVANSAPQDTISQETMDYIWSKVSKTCIGFDVYRGSYDVRSYSKSAGVAYDGSFHSDLKSLTLLIFKPIAAMPRANGHTCSFYLNTSETGVVVEKDECAALCLDKVVDLGGNNTVLKQGS